jgi:hypothetical protein
MTRQFVLVLSHWSPTAPPFEVIASEAAASRPIVPEAGVIVILSVPAVF